MIATNDIVEITQNIFNTMLQMDPVPIQIDSTAMEDLELVGSVQIAGEWSGTILLKAPQELASEAGARMLMVDLDDVVEEDRQDTLAELTNMIGGNIKSIVPSPSSLSLPSVSNGSNFSLQDYGSKPISETAFQCEKHIFRVLVFERPVG